jgi:hypothetical protein
VALALPGGDVRERALDELVRVHAIGGVAGGPVPHDPNVTGWSWTRGAFGWVEPTAWGLLALRRLRPAATDRIDDAVAMLADRECVEGGWNYGNRLVFDVALPPYVQTTAMALLGLRGLGPERTERGLAALADRWRGEQRGRLSLATACAALRAHEHPDASSAAVALRGREDDDGADTISLAWSVLALGDGLEWVVAP